MKKLLYLSVDAYGGNTEIDKINQQFFQYILCYIFKNSDVAKVMRDLGFLTEVTEEDPNMQFRARAYYRAADTIASLPENVTDIYSRQGVNGLLEIPSVGKAIASKIEEYLKRGKIRHLEELKVKVPVDIDELYGIEGLGPKTIKMFYDKLQIKNLANLEKAAIEGRLRTLPGFTEKRTRYLQADRVFQERQGSPYNRRGLPTHEANREASSTYCRRQECCCSWFDPPHERDYWRY